MVPEAIPVPVTSCPTKKPAPKLVVGAGETNVNWLPVILQVIDEFLYAPELDT